jgi:3-oxoacyl-(acyl-carrier-protein) synthase
LPRHLSPRLLDRALANAAVRPEDVGVAYLSGSGDPYHDDAELALLAAAFGLTGPLVTSVTHLTGEYGGLGALRVAASTATVTRGILPTLDYLQQPIRTDVCFATQRLSQPPAVVLVHGLARGGMQTALLIGSPQHNAKVAL